MSMKFNFDHKIIQNDMNVRKSTLYLTRESKVAEYGNLNQILSLEYNCSRDRTDAVDASNQCKCHQGCKYVKNQ